MNDSKATLLAFLVILPVVVLIGFRYLSLIYYPGMSFPRPYRSLYRSTLLVRIGRVLISLFLIGYALHGIWGNSFWLPDKHSGFYLHGTPALVMAGSFFCLALESSLKVIGFYYRRYPESVYRILSCLVGFIGWVLVMMALLLSIPSR